MSKSNDESKQPTGLDRRAVMRGALAVGGASILATAAAGAATGSAPAPTPALQVVAEQEWARVLSRVIVNQLPQAVAQVPDIRLTATQVAELQRAFQNTLITNMGCTTG